MSRRELEQTVIGWLALVRLRKAIDETEREMQIAQREMDGRLSKSEAEAMA